MKHILGYILGHKTSFNKFRRTKIIQIMFYNYSAIKAELRQKSVTIRQPEKSPNIQMLSITLQNNLWVKKKKLHTKKTKKTNYGIITL